MEGTDINTGYADGDVNHDHTFYGNGCSNPFDTTKPDEGYGGATKACDSRTITTTDNETQSEGTNYSFQAITAGSGGSGVTTTNLVIPDSFCPLGWQVPYGGTGGDYYDQSKSVRYLFTVYSTYNGNFDNVSRYPMSLVKSGDYRFQLARYFEKSRIMHEWTNTNSGINTGFRIYNTTAQYSDGKSLGLTVRCVLGISNLKAPHGIRVYSLVLWLFIF